MNLFSKEVRRDTSADEGLDRRRWNFRVALQLLDVLPDLEFTDHYDIRAGQLAPSVHMFLAEAGIIKPGQHFVGLRKKDLTATRVPRNRTAHYPYHQTGIFDGAKALAKTFFGFEPSAPPEELIMPAHAVPTLIALMISHADGLAGGGNGLSYSQDGVNGTYHVLEDQLSQIGLKLPSVDLSDKRAIRQSLDLQTL